MRFCIKKTHKFVVFIIYNKALFLYRVLSIIFIVITQIFVKRKNMNKSKELGIIGEDIACHYLIKKGYHILQRNMKNRIGEIDVVAQKDDLIIFVEVKTRQSLDYGLPLEAINAKKQHKIRNAAISYLKYKGLLDKVNVRFDCISIISQYDSYKIDYLENIF